MLNFTYNKDFEILKSLGKGSSATTFLVKPHDDSEKRFALKVFSHEKSPEIFQNFEREWRFLESLDHPHLAKVIQHFNQKNESCLVTEYVEGKDFVTACQTLDWNAIFILIVQCAWALEYLHSKSFIHRDLKPGNILVGKVFEKGSSHNQERLVLKIIDFGLACSLGHAEHIRETVGTLPYIAPEILKKENYDTRADLYALGVILYEIAVGRLPLEVKGQFSQYLNRLAHEEVDLFSLQEWGTPRGIVEIISSLLKNNPGQRLQKAFQIIEILNHCENENFSFVAPELASQEKNELVPVELSEFEKRLEKKEVVETLKQFSRSGDKEKALNLAKFYFDQVGQWENEQDVSEFYATLIHLWIDRGNFSQAEKTLKKFQEHPSFGKRALLEKELSLFNLYYRKGELKEADQKSKELISENILSIAQPAQKARFYNLCALISKDNKKWKEGVYYFEQASEFAKKAARPDQELALLLNAAALSFEQDEWVEAYRLYQRSKEMAQEQDNKVLLANITNNLGNLFLIFGRWNEADRNLRESLAFAKKQGLKPLITSNLNLLTKAEEGKGNWEKVESLIQESLNYAEVLGDAQPILQAYLEKAYFELNRGKYVECFKSLEWIREKANKQMQAFYIYQSDWLEARCKIAQGDSSVLSFDLLQKVKSEASKYDLLRSLWEVSVDEAHYYENVQDRESAKNAYLDALTLLEKIQEKIPKEFRESFWRDRKKEAIQKSLKKLDDNLVVSLESQKINFNFQSLFFSESKSSKGEIVMNIQVPKDEEQKSTPSILSFEKWVEINRRLLSQTKTNQILDEIMDDAIAITDAERGFVIYSHEQALDIKSSRNMEGKTLQGEEERFSYTIAQEVMRKGESIMIADAQKDDRFSGAASVLSLKIRSVLCVPLKAGLKTVGLVYLDNRFREGVFKKEHLPIVEALTDQTSLALEHARLHEENLSKIEELKKTKELIEKLNQRLEKDLQNTSADLVAAKESIKRQNEEISLRYTYDKIIGESLKIKNVLKKIDRVVESNMSVFIHGESGTGKELIAQAIHFNGARKDKPFVAENCTALPETLLESELFGHVQGAFTGADKNKIGLFELANGGTLFLDEVGDMPLTMQAKLLRVLQEGEVRQVGGKEYKKVDVRIITASNKDLRQLVNEGKFRQDLYYRINVIQIDLPPLRERREDIPLLINYFIEQECNKLGQPKPKVTKDAMKILSNYEWPGNIRELLNEVTRCISLRDNSIDVSSLSTQIVERVEQGEQQIGQKGLDFLISLVEKKAIMDAMYKARGNKVKAAKILKIGRRTLYAKIDLYKIDSEFGKEAMLSGRSTSSKLVS